MVRKKSRRTEMDEDLNDEELESKTQAITQDVDRIQSNETAGVKDTDANFTQSTPRVSTFRRYWYKNDDTIQRNIDIENTKQAESKQSDNKETKVLNISSHGRSNSETVKTKPLNETTLLSSRSYKPDARVNAIIPKSEKTNNDNKVDLVVELQSSDDDDVVEVALPPKPTITIESSDDEELSILTPLSNKKEVKTITTLCKKGSPRSSRSLATRPRDTNRDISASPVPSVVSSVSDDFIRGDCIAFNISSRKPEQPTFDFSVHGSDLVIPTSPASHKKKKKKNKNKAAALAMSNVSAPVIDTQECFATPNNKSKNGSCNTSNTDKANLSQNTSRKANLSQNASAMNKTEFVQQSSLNNASLIPLPNANIYHVGRNSTEPESKKGTQNNEVSVEKVETLSLNNHSTLTMPKVNPLNDQRNKPEPETIDLIEESSDLSSPVIGNEIVMGNVTGFQKDEDYTSFVAFAESDSVKLGSTKVPEILSGQLDFDTKTGIFRFKNIRTLSEHSLKIEMEKFYNESWGGEDFNHKEILKHLPRDKNLWRIDAKDRFSTPSKRKIICSYCNRPGHRDELCYRKPSVCHMCGEKGHREPRCPNKICVNCGSPNHIFSTSCRNCAGWNRIVCAECGQLGHPSTHCPDIWRRYHNTIDTESPLVENRQAKQHYELFCSGCCRRGHLIHQCRSTLPFSGLAINAPYVANYISIYPPSPKDMSPCVQEFGLNSENCPIQVTNRSNKRQSKSPVAHESHQTKKRYYHYVDDKPSVPLYTTKSHQQSRNLDKNHSESGSQEPKQLTEVPNDTVKEKNVPKKAQVEPMPDFIPITAKIHEDTREQAIQDNEVSTSGAVASARVYITKDVVEKLNATSGENFLKDMAQKHNVTTNLNVVELIINVDGSPLDQEAFQADLRAWAQDTSKDKLESDKKSDGDISNDERSQLICNIPKNRDALLQKLHLAFESLKQNLGDPKVIYKELNYAQKKHEQLTKQKVISPKQLSNNRSHINDLLRKLNMILLGQAGLGDGWRHLQDLRALMDNISSCPSKNVSKALKEQVGLHYCPLFTSHSREDYDELLKKYYASKGKSKIDRTQHRATGRSGLQGNRFKTPLKSLGVKAAMQYFQSKSNFFMHNVKNEMIVHQEQIADIKPACTTMSQMKNRLVHQLNSYIKSIDDNVNFSPKMFKRMWKVQLQAALFLTRV